jgi:hypothetical protein
MFQSALDFLITTGGACAAVVLLLQPETNRPAINTGADPNLAIVATFMGDLLWISSI